MKAYRHNTCLGVRGIKFFKCSTCGAENSNNYMNGINSCKACCEKDNICCLCGKPLASNKTKRRFVIDIECEEFEHNIKNKTEALQPMAIEIALSELMTSYVDANSIKPDYHIEVKEI